MERNYNTLFADVNTWAKEGWVDVVIPQLYFATGNDATSFNSEVGIYGRNIHMKPLIDRIWLFINLVIRNMEVSFNRQMT